VDAAKIVGSRAGWRTSKEKKKGKAHEIISKNLKTSTSTGGQNGHDHRLVNINLDVEREKKRERDEERVHRGKMTENLK